MVCALQRAGPALETLISELSTASWPSGPARRAPRSDVSVSVGRIFTLAGIPTCKADRTRSRRSAQQNNGRCSWSLVEDLRPPWALAAKCVGFAHHRPSKSR